MHGPSSNDPALTGPLRGNGPPDFDATYVGTPPWDIGRPQAAFLELAQAGELHGRVLDVGCGTGEHALMAARLGFDATGVDSSPRAINIATAKAEERGLSIRFLVRAGDRDSRDGWRTAGDHQSADDPWPCASGPGAASYGHDGVQRCH
jgi:SAM-dependent methyltransferase